MSRRWIDHGRNGGRATGFQKPSTTLMTSTLEASNCFSYAILVGGVGTPFDPIEFSSYFRMT